MNKNFAELDAEANAKVYYGQNNQVALNAGLLPNGLGSGFLLRDTSGTPAIAMYVDNVGTPILKVAKGGKDAVSGVGSDLIFNSSQNALKIVKKGTIVIPRTILTGGTNVYSSGNAGWPVYSGVPHNLGYTPIVFGFSTEDTTTYKALPFRFNWGVSQTAFTQLGIGLIVNSTDVTAVLEAFSYNGAAFGSDPIGPFNITYYLLQETAN